MNQELLSKLKKEYPIGTRIELVKMNDVQAPPIGTKGTVRGVDDIGSILVSWDTGSSLNVVFGEDIIKKVHSVKTICYGKERIWDSREKAISFFEEGILACEGSERDRYLSIVCKLKCGLEVCSDD